MDSFVVPIFKYKGDIHTCGNYKGIKLTNYNMIWEQVIEKKIRKNTLIYKNQFGFM